MTAVVGVRCDDGIVICADRQVSVPGAFKYFEKKIDVIERPNDEHIIIGYSGLPTLAKEAREKLSTRLDENEFQKTLAEVVHELVDNVLTEMGRHYVALELELLIGTAVLLDSPTFLKFDGKGLHKADNFSFLGVGDSSLLRYLASVLYSPNLTLSEIQNLAIYLVAQAESYIDHCGGPIDLYYMGLGGGYEILPHPEIQEILKKMEAQEGSLAEIILRKPFSSPRD